MAIAQFALKVVQHVPVPVYVKLVCLDMKKKADTGVLKHIMKKLNVFIL